MPEATKPNSEEELAGVARALGASRVGRPSAAERRVLALAGPVAPALVRDVSAAIARGEDPLGDALCRLRSPAVRRPLGATYTPEPLVRAMTAWASRRTPARVVEPGAGSGRFLVAAGRAFARAELVAVEIDPLAALLCRAHLSAAGLGARARVVVGDYREIALDAVSGPTLFIGNPPYVRHHGITPAWKRWLRDTARELGLSASLLAGLHVHFALRTAELGQPGDYGAFVTAAEWLDVNYGALFRALVTGPLGGTSLHAVAPTARVFADADTTAVIACFELGSAPASLRLQRVDRVSELATLGSGKRVARARLAGASRWTPLFGSPPSRPHGFVELGELCRVHRGQVTGRNAVWIEGTHSRMLPENVLFRTVTRARELFVAGEALARHAVLRRVIDLPLELDSLSTSERRAVERFLRVARELGAHRGFVAEHRRAWWSVGLYEPAPILATYMARRTPAFVRNLAFARHINVAHGLYPRDLLPESTLDALARYLAGATRLADGRTYAGGLTKFEPREMERLLVPEPSLLARGFGTERARRGKLV
ncbi:MAG TPA: class I SAM-dependent methyltransferase [Polyangiaceae bacterium]